MKKSSVLYPPYWCGLTVLMLFLFLSVFQPGGPVCPCRSTASHQHPAAPSPPPAASTQPSQAHRHGGRTAAQTSTGDPPRLTWRPASSAAGPAQYLPAAMWPRAAPHTDSRASCVAVWCTTACGQLPQLPCGWAALLTTRAWLAAPSGGVLCQQPSRLAPHTTARHSSPPGLHPATPTPGSWGPSTQAVAAYSWAGQTARQPTADQATQWLASGAGKDLH